MAAKLESLKLKNIVSGDSSDENDKDAGDDLGLNLEKLNLGPRKKLLVLSLNGLLVHRVHVQDQSSVRGYKPDVFYGNFLVFKRPYCGEFLKFCLKRFEVGVWSSAREHNVDAVLSNMMVGLRSKLSFVWGQNNCTDSGFSSLENTRKPIFLKELKGLWEDGQYSSSNTLLIDDDPYTALLNPPNTAIFVKQFKVNDGEDTLLVPKGDLQDFLDGLADAQDVPSYVKDHPFGQPAITASHPDWNYYSKIVRKFAKAESAS